MASNRREFLRRKVTKSTELVTSMLPKRSATIGTDGSGLVIGEIEIPTADGHIPGYRAMPKNGKLFPVVLVVHEIFGVHEHIKDICRRFAKLGYLAIAPELFARQGEVAAVTNIQDLIERFVSKASDGQVMADLDATVNWAESSGHGNIQKLGITGFGWGGRMTWLYAAHQPRLKAAVAWYGRVADLPLPRVPLLGISGARDQGIPQEAVEHVRAALKTAGDKKSELVVYPDAGHGFHADYRTGYDAAAAKDGWARMQAWFQKYGAA